MFGDGGEYCGDNLESDEDCIMTMHYDANGWPCVGKYIGLLSDGDEPIFYTPEQQKYYESQECKNKILMAYLMQNAYGRNPLL